MSDLIPNLQGLIGWFMIAGGIAVAAMISFLIIGDDDDR